MFNLLTCLNVKRALDDRHGCRKPFVFEPEEVRMLKVCSRFGIVAAFFLPSKVSCLQSMAPTTSTPLAPLGAVFKKIRHSVYVVFAIQAFLAFLSVTVPQQAMAEDCMSCL
jgi:hypothetical protein